MRLKTLTLQNFRGYEDHRFFLHPQFNLIVGENGMGKTSLLEAAAVAVGSWLLGIRGHDTRSIRARDVRVVRTIIEGQYRELFQYPVRVSATGEITVALAKRQPESGEITVLDGAKVKSVSWSRSVDGAGGRTTQQGANTLKKFAVAMEAAVLKGEPCVLPLIRYFGAGRLWESVRDSDSKAMSKFKAKQPQELIGNDELDQLFSDAEKMAAPFLKDVARSYLL